MKRKILLILRLSLIVLFCGACSSNDDTHDTHDADGAEEELNLNQALFLDPLKIRDKKSDTKIMDSIVHYLDNTPKGAEVRVSIYHLSYQPMLQALKKASERGVEVHVLVDHNRSGSKDNNSKTVPFLENSFEESSSEVIKVKSDISGSPSPINHHKEVLFSEIDLPKGKAEDVVFTTSHNFTSAGTKKVQDAIIMSNNELYNAFVNDWEDVKSRAESGMKNFEYTVKNIGDSITVDFFPRRKNGEWDGEDTYIDILDKVNDYSNAEVRVVMSDFSRIEVAEKLVELQKNGYDVKVFTKNKSGNMDALDKLKDLEKEGGELYVVDMSKQNTHSKFVLIRGKVNGEEKKIINTGTHNFTYYALKYNNETLLELRNSSHFDQYWQYFDDLVSVYLK